MSDNMSLFLKSLKQPANKPLDYFLSYVKVESQSDETSGTWPSSQGQLNLAGRLVDDLAELGLDAELDENGYVMAKLAANCEQPAGSVKLGLLAHIDTSPDLSGENVLPRIVHYEGGPIPLNEDKNIMLDPAVFPNLLPYVGQDLVVTDGNTLLGADDKAGVAAIVGLIAYLKANPELPHGELRFAFTPDEEIGLGPQRFDVPAFDADFAYTVDGGLEGELEYENFNAAAAKVRISGRNVHPGSAKDKMINATLVARRFSQFFDASDTPEHTEGKEGFYHLTDWSSSVETATLSYIIRDFDAGNFSLRKQAMLDAARSINRNYGEELVRVELRDQYYNMKSRIEPYPFLIDLARRAMLAAEVEPLETAVRGGTDGAQLSYKGLPCPNLFTGGENFHGRYEFLSINSFHKSIETLIYLVQLYSQLDLSDAHSPTES